MIRQFFLLLSLIVCTASLSAQVEYKEEKVKITSIKKNSDYIYAEAYGDTYQEALETAEKGLYSEIKKLISENTNLQDADAIMVGTVKQNSAQIALKRGEMERVFLYVKKDHVFAKKNVLTMERTAPAATEQPAAIEETVAQVAESATTSAEPIDVQEAIEVQEPISIAEEVVIEEVPAQEAVAADIPNVEVIETVEPEATSERVVTASPILNKILSISEVAALQQYMRTQKEEHKLIWGNVTTEVNPSWYVIVYSNAGVQAVLDKGINKRVNLLSGETQSLSDYKGYSKVWFLLYE